MARRTPTASSTSSKGLPVVETFKSIEGEGMFQGLPAIFLRLAGCNLKCDFCDTDFTKGEILTIPTIWKRIENLRNKANLPVVLTGGEPLIHPTLPALLERLCQEDVSVHLETNGTLFPEVLRYHDFHLWVTVSPKDGAPIKLLEYTSLRDVMFKILVTHEGMLVGHEKDILTLLDHFYPRPISFQPVWYSSWNSPRTQNAVKHAYNWVMRYPKAHLSLQLHKLIGVR